MDGRQELFVNIKTDKGKNLYDGMFGGKTKYPNEFSAKLSVGHNLLMSSHRGQRRQGLDLIAKAFDSNPSPDSMIDLLRAAQPGRVGRAHQYSFIGNGTHGVWYEWGIVLIF